MYVYMNADDTFINKLSAIRLPFFFLYKKATSLDLKLKYICKNYGAFNCPSFTMARLLNSQSYPKPPLPAVFCFWDGKPSPNFKCSTSFIYSLLLCWEGSDNNHSFL